MRDKCNRKNITINLDEVHLRGILSLPATPSGMVIFSHGSGSSRLSTRNNFVADALNELGFATMLFDLLTEIEDQHYPNRFDIELLTDRLIAVTQYTRMLTGMKDLPIGYFGASTGAASAINAAARLGTEIKAVVSRGGRPDLSEKDHLERLLAPILLIVGGYDKEVIRLNQAALKNIRAVKELTIIEKASHLFEESGKLQEVTRLSASWFIKHLN